MNVMSLRSHSIRPGTRAQARAVGSLKCFTKPHTTAQTTHCTNHTTTHSMWNLRKLLVVDDGSHVLSHHHGAPKHFFPPRHGLLVLVLGLLWFACAVVCLLWFCEMLLLWCCLLLATESATRQNDFSLIVQKMFARESLSFFDADDETFLFVVVLSHKPDQPRFPFQQQQQQQEVEATMGNILCDGAPIESDPRYHFNVCSGRWGWNERVCVSKRSECLFASFSLAVLIACSADGLFAGTTMGDIHAERPLRELQRCVVFPSFFLIQEGKGVGITLWSFTVEPSSAPIVFSCFPSF